MVAAPIVETDISKINSLFELQKASHRVIGKSTAKERIRKLKKFQKVLMKYRPEIREAMWKEYRKPAAEVDLTEIFPLTSEIKHTCSNLRIWMRDEAVDTPLALFGSSSWVRYEPKGLCLIISPWNYPLQLGFGPLISAIAAGNTVILKPSEAMPHTSAIMKKIVGETFDEKEVAVVEGAVETATTLLDLPFSHIFFTGAPSIGKIVMKAAAKHLTSVTLELGGKSPTIIDETANIGSIVNRIAWAKFCNNGQICIAPDYILIHESKKEEFLNKLQKQLAKHYGDDPLQSPDYMRIVNKRHFNRVKGYLENTVSAGGKVAFGGKMKAEENYIEPTVLTDVPMNSDVMQYEIFGPLLPVITYKNKEEVIDIINSKEKPLALYIYSRSKKNTKYFIENTTAGGTSINMSGVHFGNMNLPFGGVNNSGIGKSHGHYGFKEFSNARGVFKQWLPSAIEFMMPPYNKVKEKMIDLTIKWFYTNSEHCSTIFSTKTFTEHHSVLYMQNELFGIPNLDIYLVMGILVFFGMLEVISGYLQRSQRKSDDWIQEFGGFLVLSLAIKPLIVGSAYFFGTRFFGETQGILNTTSFWLTLPIYLLVDDFLQYWYHRSAHEYPFLWKLHRAHHQAEEMGFFVSYRNAGLYYLMMPNIWWMGLFTFLGGGLAVAAGLVIKQLIIIGSHSTVTWDSFFYKNKILSPLMTVIERIIITPAFHHAHHGKSKLDGVSDPNGNFGNMFSIWDQLFGTAIFTRQFPKEYGLMNAPEEHWTASYFYPIITADDKENEMSRGHKKTSTTFAEPTIVHLEKDKNYLYCQCGFSKNQPFCDGSHHGTKIKPLLFTTKRTGKVKLCNCKLTQGAPFCDNSHEEF